VYLPAGYVALKVDFGTRLKAKRRQQRLKQASVADDIGIARETLSRIEQGRPPRGSILLALLAKLEMDISEVADPDPTNRGLAFTGGARGDDLLAIGHAILEKRRQLHMSLEEAAKLIGLSAATLSRLERSQSPRSRVLKELPKYAAMDLEDRQVTVHHAKLQEFLASPCS